MTFTVLNTVPKLSYSSRTSLLSLAFGSFSFFSSTGCSKIIGDRDVVFKFVGCRCISAFLNFHGS